jgi:hypothetical protein
MNTEKLVLDACCGSRMFWFDNTDERAMFVDRREDIKVIDIGTPGTVGRKPVVIKPDKVADFRNLPFCDNSFHHIVFDPPHLYKKAGSTGIIAFKYGLLEETWEDDLKKGFSECFRVLKPCGTLIFKWCETEILLKNVLKLTEEKPLYGHRSGKRSMTHWVCFIKPSVKTHEHANKLMHRTSR